jgi:hypothetical protein
MVKGRNRLRVVKWAARLAEIQGLGHRYLDGFPKFRLVPVPARTIVSRRRKP